MDLNIIYLNSKQSANKRVSIVSNSTDTIEQLKLLIKNNLKLNLLISQIDLYRTTELGNKVHFIDDTRTLQSYNIQNNTIIYVEDLKYQIDGKTAAIIIYTGPILIMLYYFWNNKNTNFIQTIAFMMNSIYYSKRIIEILYVHIYSKNKLTFNMFLGGIVYYWFIYAYICSVNLFDNKNRAFFSINKLIYIVVFVFSEYMNMKTHLVLRNIKLANNGMKGLPKGYLFDYVSSANYFWELVSWIAIALFVDLWSFYLFAIAGFISMSMLAKQKHNLYREIFFDYWKRTYAFIPFLF